MYMYCFRFSFDPYYTMNYSSLLEFLAVSVSGVFVSALSQIMAAWFSTEEATGTCSSSPSVSVIDHHRLFSRWLCLSHLRAVYRVASVQPVISTHSSVLTRSAPHLSSFPHPLPPSLPLPQFPPQVSSAPQGGGGDTSSQSHPHLYPIQPQQHSQHLLHQSSTQSLHLSHSQPTSHSLSQPRSQCHSQPSFQSQPNPEQNGILDWLRRLRLHKYYPVFKQLTMEEVSQLQNQWIVRKTW